ncbi:MAG: histidinol dehydrogenase [Oscillospiraceae bacterium]|jgi:histidinol dehydrogenase|nr:histidinol dehydrogenase [Oscillospiraceae bacterium]
MIKIYKSSDPEVQARLNRAAERDAAVENSVANIIAKTRSRGLDAVLEYTKKFDGVTLDADTVEVSREEIDAAYAQVDGAMIGSLKKSAERIREFHAKQLRGSTMDYLPDRALGVMIRPLERVGIYAPGGTAFYPSSVLMNAVPAKVAGVPEIIMVTPPDRKTGGLSPLTLAAADIAGVDRIFKVGGAQAIAALAFGAAPIPRVDKITGPGNAYVAEAKRQVFGQVGIDSVAGPSEVFIIADFSAKADWVAADLLAQAEHDERAQAILATPSAELAQAVAVSLERQANERDRKSIIGKSIDDYGIIIVTETLEEAFDTANKAAPEHLELCIDHTFSRLGLVKNAGAVFLGHFTPESVGDYIAGSNHVLPTSGTARFFSGLSVDDFIKKTSVVFYTKSALKGDADDIERIALGEGLDAHARSATIRFDT